MGMRTSGKTVYLSVFNSHLQAKQENFKNFPWIYESDFIKARRFRDIYEVLSGPDPIFPPPSTHSSVDLDFCLTSLNHKIKANISIKDVGGENFNEYIENPSLDESSPLSQEIQNIVKNTHAALFLLDTEYLEGMYDDQDGRLYDSQVVDHISRLIELLSKFADTNQKCRKPIAIVITKSDLVNQKNPVRYLSDKGLYTVVKYVKEKFHYHDFFMVSSTGSPYKKVDGVKVPPTPLNPMQLEKPVQFVCERLFPSSIQLQILFYKTRKIIYSLSAIFLITFSTWFYHHQRNSYLADLNLQKLEEDPQRIEEILTHGDLFLWNDEKKKRFAEIFPLYQKQNDLANIFSKREKVLEELLKYDEFKNSIAWQETLRQCKELNQKLNRYTTLMERHLPSLKPKRQKYVVDSLVTFSDYREEWEEFFVEKEKDSLEKAKEVLLVTKDFMKAKVQERDFGLLRPYRLKRELTNADKVYECLVSLESALPQKNYAEAYDACEKTKDLYKPLEEIQGEVFAQWWEYAAEQVPQEIENATLKLEATNYEESIVHIKNADSIVRDIYKEIFLTQSREDKLQSWKSSIEDLKGRWQEKNFQHFLQNARYGLDQNDWKIAKKNLEAAEKFLVDVSNEQKEIWKTYGLLAECVRLEKASQYFNAYNLCKKSNSTNKMVEEKRDQVVDTWSKGAWKEFQGYIRSIIAGGSELKIQEKISNIQKARKALKKSPAYRRIPSKYFSIEKYVQYHKSLNKYEKIFREQAKREARIYLWINQNQYKKAIIETNSEEFKGRVLDDILNYWIKRISISFSVNEIKFIVEKTLIPDTLKEKIYKKLDEK